jgi:SAM-dependent methyltransferase
MFRLRSSQKELLDATDVPRADLFRNLQELDFINRWLGGYSISFRALSKVLSTDRAYTIVDIGSGGGDTLRRIHRWQKRHSFDLKLVGIDLKPDCVEYAREKNKHTSAFFVCDDYRHVFSYVPDADIIHACLFCHHLRDDELIGLIRFASQHQAILVINDLERNPLAYYSIKWLTALFSRSYLVKHDAPLSVTRGFKKREWIDLINKAGAIRYSVKNRWAFRHEVIIYPDKPSV